MCKESKPVGDFFKNKSRHDGKQSECKNCSSLRGKKYYGDTKDKNREENIFKARKWFHSRKTDINVFVKVMYRGIRDRSKRAYRPSYYLMPICSQQEFEEMALQNESLKKLYKEWIESGHFFHLTPSVDRIDNKKGYLIDNIQFLTFIENTRKH